MRPRRQRAGPSELSAEDAELIAELCASVVNLTELCRELRARYDAGTPAAELRGPALEHACRAAAQSRAMIVLQYAEQLNDRLPPRLRLRAPYEALARLAYTFTALAQDEVEESELLSQEELDALLADPELQEWMDAARPYVMPRGADA